MARGVEGRLGALGALGAGLDQRGVTLVSGQLDGGGAGGGRAGPAYKAFPEGLEEPTRRDRRGLSSRAATPAPGRAQERTWKAGTGRLGDASGEGKRRERSGLAR